ncbi:MAG TPA: DUF6498-containing protein, partial [Gammaproteobacteria bacterium]|nr:DUF6498-containing protein [Gammaproteobacteria bacterium]
ALFSSHAFSFIRNYLGRGVYLNTDVKSLMVRPYGRIPALHVTVIIGGFFLLSLGSPVTRLVLLIFLKVGFNLRAHHKEHKEKLRAATSDEPTFKEILVRLNEVKRGAGAAPSGSTSGEFGREP